MIKHFYQNIGEDWFTYAEFYKQIVEKFSDGAHFVEVGSWKGRSASYMAVEIHNSNKKIKFDCVDKWDGSDEIFYQKDEAVVNNVLYEVFLKNTEPVKHIINPIKMTSVEASKLYSDESLDFVFIDACHDYECVKEDIKAWYPKIKKGGIISGHDFNVEEVKKAVVEQINNFYAIGVYDIWLKNKEQL
jgi:predicted O-methyltransferase YrrM